MIKTFFAQYHFIHKKNPLTYLETKQYGLKLSLPFSKQNHNKAIEILVILLWFVLKNRTFHG